MGSPEMYHDAVSFTNTQTTEPPLIAHMQAQLDKAASHRNPNSKPLPRSKYNNVYVLLLSWADDDLGVIEELEKLNKLFRDTFNFTTRTWTIPSEEPEHELMREIMNFRKGKIRGDLIILYYGGHAGGNPQECIWAAKEDDDPPTLNWHNVQSYLLGSSADVLLILDCCFATLAARNYGIGDNWFFGASTKESVAEGVSRFSFTSALNRELERNAYIYWDLIDKIKRKPHLDWQSDPRFTIEDIHHVLNVWERDLKFTPSKVRLTDHACEPTELTPLLPSKPQSARTDPHVQTPPEATDRALPIRPLASHATLPYSDTAVPQERHHVDSTTAKELSIDLSPGESQTVRISRFPPSAAKLDLIHWLGARLNSSVPILRIGPMVTSPTASTTVTFASVAIAKQALAIHDRRFHIKAGGPPTSIGIDNHFLGLTCLHLPPRSLAAIPNLDLVLVHGAHGHAVNSFACHYTNPSSEALWAIDALPKALEARAIYPRIMTFGWNADACLNSPESMNQECEELIKAIESERTGAPERPIAFVGHGIGGLLIKQVVNEIIDSGLCRDNFENPVKGCFFFAVPHHEPDSADGFASVLADMQVALAENGHSRPELVKSLKSRNRFFTNLSNVFSEICTEHSIGSVSFYEEPKNGKCVVVPKDLAVLEKKPGRAYAVDADYRHILKLSKSGHNLKLVTDVLCSTIATKLGLMPDTPQTPSKEKVYARLKKYDTVFVVDDSESMSKARWKTTAHVLAAIAAIAVQYDRDGVDIRFFNSDVEARNLDSATKVMDLFKEVEPDGPTPTADVLEVELNEYTHQYNKNRSKKGLNLIVLTDGEPEKGQNVEGIIVKFAKKLERMEAPPLQVGVQFVQIGGDKEAAEFLRSLDDDLKEKYELDRDVC